MNRMVWTTAAIVALSGLSSAATAQTAPQSSVADRLTACRAIAGPTERLACYDAAAAAFESARTGGDLVVMSRDEIQESRRRAFGFNVNILGALQSAVGGETLESISSPVEDLRQSQGAWIVTLEDGSTWAQVDRETVQLRMRPGLQAEVRRAALGTYFMKIGSARAFRVQRR